MQITDEMVLAAAKSDYAFDNLGDWDQASRIDRERYCQRSHAALTAALAEMWQPRSLAPLDSTVLVCVEPTEHNSLWNNQERATFPAYIDEDGRICDPSTWAPDSNLDGHMWRTTHFMPLPSPPAQEGR